MRTGIWIIVVNQDTSQWRQAGLWRSLAGYSVSELGFNEEPCFKTGREAMKDVTPYVISNTCIYTYMPRYKHTTHMYMHSHAHTTHV